MNTVLAYRRCLINVCEIKAGFWLWTSPPKPSCNLGLTYHRRRAQQRCIVTPLSSILASLQAHMATCVSTLLTLFPSFWLLWQNRSLSLLLPLLPVFVSASSHTPSSPNAARTPSSPSAISLREVAKPPALVSFCPDDFCLQFPNLLWPPCHAPIHQMSPSQPSRDDSTISHAAPSPDRVPSGSTLTVDNAPSPSCANQGPGDHPVSTDFYP